MSDLSQQQVHLQGFLKIRRMAGPGPFPGEFGVGARWGMRHFRLTAEAIIQFRDENDESAGHKLCFTEISKIRWATPNESRAGFGVTFTNSVRALLGSVSGENDPGKQRSSTTSSKFVIELAGDSSEGSPQVILEAESFLEASRWMDSLQRHLECARENLELPPVVLVKEANANIREVYDLGPSLGSGMSGVVKRIVRKSDGKAFAMKTILLAQLSPRQLSALRNEIDILKVLDHPHICKLYETYTEPGVCVRLVLELCEGGELFDRLHARKRFSEQWVAKLVYRMVGVLRYLHENHITHRDLKLENWLFRSKQDDDKIVLIDFGLSHKYRPEEHMHKKVGTSYYVAPEVLKGDYMGVRADMWSLGVIVYMLLGGCAPYDGPDDDAILKNVASAKRPNFETGAWRRVSPEAKDFVQGLLTVDPEQRLDAEGAFAHPWVASLEKVMNTTEIDDDMYRNLTKFANFSTLKRIAMEVVAFSLSHEEINKMTDVFQQMDSDHNGYITFGGMKRELTKHFKITDEELRRIFDALDGEHSGKVHVNEFVAATMQFKYHLDESLLRQAFHTMDHTDSGYITVDDLKSLLGKHIDDMRALEMIQAAQLEDHGGSHRLSFHEFLDFVRKDGEEKVENYVKTPQVTRKRMPTVD